MINELQRLLYKLGCIAPMLIFVGISLGIQKVNWKWCMLFILIGVMASIYVVEFITICRKKLPPLTITVDNVSQDDNVAIAYILTYLIPMIGIVWKDNHILWIAMAVISILFLMKISNLDFCPILLLINYHCYKVSLSTGISDCIFISRKKDIRNTNQITTVLRVGNSLLIDEDGGI